MRVGLEGTCPITEVGEDEKIGVGDTQYVVVEVRQREVKGRQEPWKSGGGQVREEGGR